MIIKQTYTAITKVSLVNIKVRPFASQSKLINGPQPFKKQRSGTLWRFQSPEKWGHHMMHSVVEATSMIHSAVEAQHEHGQERTCMKAMKCTINRSMSSTFETAQGREPSPHYRHFRCMVVEGTI